MRCGRAAVILVIALLPVATVAVPSVAVAAQASCPTVLFLGAHGVGEGGGSSTSPWTDQWGTTIQAVWYLLNLNGVGAVPKAVSYPKVRVPANLNGYAQLGQWVTTKLAPSSITGNTSLINDMTSTYSACPQTLFLLAGYSQGAWIINHILHYFKGGQLGNKILAKVRGVFLMGDPAWPKTTQTPKLEGVVDYYASSVSAVLPASVYPYEADYLANGLPAANFWSICAGGDPICHYDGSTADLEANVKIHGALFKTPCD